MAQVKPQSIKSVSATKGATKRELYASVCYFYPQYTLKQVQNLPARDITLLLKAAERQQAKHFHNLTQIVASPHSKKGTSVGKLLDYYKGLVEK